MARSDYLCWGALLIVVLLLGGGVLSYARLAIADFEEEATKSSLLTPQVIAGARLLKDKSLEL